jgi:hypothetical protein
MRPVVIVSVHVSGHPHLEFESCEESQQSKGGCAAVIVRASIYLPPASFNSWQATHNDTDGFASNLSNGIASPQFAH